MPLCFFKSSLSEHIRSLMQKHWEGRIDLSPTKCVQTAHDTEFFLALFQTDCPWCFTSLGRESRTTLTDCVREEKVFDTGPDEDEGLGSSKDLIAWSSSA